jgi:Fic family protein
MKDKFHLSIEDNIFLAKKIVVQNIYNAAKLEGVNTTFPETEAILGGVNVPHARLDDITVILNLRDAWRWLFDEVERAKIDLKFIEKLNENVSRNESLAWGKLRHGRAGIAGTDHHPPVPNRAATAREINKILTDKAKSTTDKAVDVMLYIMYHQLFWDGNKRTAALAANAVLIQNGAGMLSVADSDIVEFNRLLTEYYNFGLADELERFIYDRAIIDSGRRITSANVPLNVPENVPLNPTEIAVLDAISNNPFITADEIAAEIGKTRKTVQRATSELKAREIILRVGSDKTGHWSIRKD